MTIMRDEQKFGRLSEYLSIVALYCIALHYIDELLFIMRIVFYIDWRGC
jgi:hypothetical protein